LRQSHGGKGEGDASLTDSKTPSPDTPPYLAGKPKDEDALKAAGVEVFLYAGCDALALLTEAYANLNAE